jgi:hypothetical protein
LATLDVAPLTPFIAGGPAPLIATWLFGVYHSPYVIAIYIVICAIITLIATALMIDYTGKDISGEYEQGLQASSARPNH